MTPTPRVSNEVLIECLRKRIKALEKRNKVLADSAAQPANTGNTNHRTALQQKDARISELQTQVQAQKTKTETDAVVIQWFREDREARINARRCICCLREYGGDVVPSILYCGHAICIACVRNIAVPARRQLDQRHRQEDRHVVACPECRQAAFMRLQHLTRNYGLVPGYVRPPPSGI